MVKGKNPRTQTVVFLSFDKYIGGVDATDQNVVVNEQQCAKERGVVVNIFLIFSVIIVTNA